MPDLSYLYNMNSVYMTGGTSTWYVIGGVLALVGAIAVAIVFIRSENRKRYTGLMKRIATHVNFERYVIPLILKFLYVLTALAAIFNGIITMFASSFWSGLLMAVFGPVVVRMVYELIMMLFSIHNGIMETNRLLRGGARPRDNAPQQYARPMHQQQPEGGMEERRPEQPKRYPGGYDPMHRG
jgi:hypothetical protein